MFGYRSSKDNLLRSSFRINCLPDTQSSVVINFTFDPFRKYMSFLTTEWSWTFVSSRRIDFLNDIKTFEETSIKIVQNNKVFQKTHGQEYFPKIPWTLSPLLCKFLWCNLQKSIFANGNLQSQYQQHSCKNCFFLGENKFWVT